MTGIFISYRRADSEGYVGRIYDYLAERFDKRNLFLDVTTINAGADFPAAIGEALNQCSALVAVIGPHWLDAADSRGRRRLDQPDDYVRLEVATALRQGLQVIPALVQNAPMPKADELPEELASLAKRNSIEISPQRFDYDMSQLVKALGGAYGQVIVVYSAGPTSCVIPGDDAIVLVDGIGMAPLVQIRKERKSALGVDLRLTRRGPQIHLSGDQVGFVTPTIRVKEGLHTLSVSMSGPCFSEPLAFRVRGGEHLRFILRMKSEANSLGQHSGYRLTLEPLVP